MLWALYLPAYPKLTVEIAIGDRYKPDVVALDVHGQPVFWGEAGDVTTAKIRSLARRYRDTHFALAKWDAGLEPYGKAVATVSWPGCTAAAPFDLIRFPADSANRFVDDEGAIRLSHADLAWVRLS